MALQLASAPPPVTTCSACIIVTCRCYYADLSRWACVASWERARSMGASWGPESPCQTLAANGAEMEKDP